jgi:hypothetical protein
VRVNEEKLAKDEVLEGLKQKFNTKAPARGVKENEGKVSASVEFVFHKALQSCLFCFLITDVNVAQEVKGTGV